MENYEIVYEEDLDFLEGIETLYQPKIVHNLSEKRIVRNRKKKIEKKLVKSKNKKEFNFSNYIKNLRKFENSLYQGIGFYKDSIFINENLNIDFEKVVLDNKNLIENFEKEDLKEFLKTKKIKTPKKKQMKKRKSSAKKKKRKINNLYNNKKI